MKIAVASDDRKKIAGHFGRCRGFVIAETKGGEITEFSYRENDFTGHARGQQHNHQHDHRGRHARILEALADCETVISRGMGRRIYEDLHSAGIQAVITSEELVEPALKQYVNGELVDYPDQQCDHQH